jgi:hypothetical protein
MLTREDFERECAPLFGAVASLVDQVRGWARYHGKGTRRGTGRRVGGIAAAEGFVRR